MKELNSPVAPALVFLVAIVSACAPAPTPLPTAVQPKSTPLPTQTAMATRTPPPTSTPAATPTAEKQQPTKDPSGLITIEQLTALSGDLGVADWQLAEDQPGQACREFVGQGEMLTRIPAGNCILAAESQTFAQVLEFLKEKQAIKPSAVAIDSSYEYMDDYALYRYYDETRGYAVYDALLLRNGLLYWAWIDFATPIVSSPESLFADYDAAIDTFLHEILTTNLRERQ